MSTKYVSGRLKKLNVGISSYSEGKTSLSVTGNVGIGTDMPLERVGVGNTSVLAVGILTAYRLYSTVFGEFTGGSVVADTIVGTSLSVSGVSTLGNLKIENGALSAVSSGVGLTFTGDVIGNISGIVTASSLSVTGLSTFTGAIDANSNLDVAGNLDVDGHTELDDVNVSGASTFTGAIDANGGANISGGLTANSAAVSDLTDNRIVIAGTGGELEDSSNLTFDGSTLAVTGDATFSGNVSIAGTLTKEDVTNIDSVGLITARSGVRVTGGGLTVVGTSTFSNNVDINGDLDVDGHTELDNINVTGVSTISGNLFVTGVSTFAQSNFSDRIVGSATSNVIPFLYANYSDLPSATTYHGAFAHVHSYGKGYYAHAGNWVELVNKEVDGTVGTGTERFNVGVTSFKDDVTFVTANGNNISFDKSTNRLKFGNSVKLIMGDSGSNNLNIFHNQINTIIGQSGVPLIFDVDNTIFGSVTGDKHLEIKHGESVDLYHNNSLKLSTVGYGLSITGITSTTHLNVTGVSTFGTISSLNVSGLSTFNADVNVGSAITLFSNSGIVSATEFYGSGIGLTNINASSLTGTIQTVNLPDPLPAISGANLTNLNASNLASGTVPDGRFPAVLPSISGENLTNLPVVSSFWVLNDVGIHTIRDVGIGTTNPNAVVDVNNTNKLAVGILSAYQLYGDGRNLDRVSFGSTDGNYIAKNFLQVNGGARGQSNVIIGRFAGCCHDNANHNVYLGESAARKTTTGDNNVAIGCKAGCGNTDGSQNVFLGSGAGCNSSTGSINVFIGQQAGKNNTGCYNIAFGNLAYTRNCGTKNIAIGHQAANDVGAGGTANIFIGEYAGQSAQSDDGRGGQYNTYLGHAVGYSNPGDCNIGIGYNTLNGTAACFNKNNIALGRCSGFSIRTGSYNVFFGTNSGKNTTIGQYNFFGGYKAGEANVGGACNVYIGNQAGAASTTGEQNVAIGQKAGYNNRVGSYNLFFGTCAGYNNTCGVDNIFLGKSAGKANTTASCNTFIGAEAGFYTQTGNFNSFFGQRAGLSNVSGQCNTFIGRLAASNQTAGDTNVAIGYAVQLPSLTGSNQLVIGSGSTSWVSGDSSYNVTLAGIVTAYTSGIVSATKFCGDGSCLTNLPTSGFDADADGNLFAGNTCSGCNLDGTNGCHNILFGSCAGKEVTSGACNIFLGFDAGRCSQTNSSSIYFGRNAGKSVCSGFFDVGIGDGNFCCSKHACANVAIGKNVFEVLNCGGGGALAGMRNIGIGDEVGAALTTGRYNVFMGYYVARCLASDCKNIFIGCRTAFRTTSGCANIFIGEYAGKSDVLGCAGSNNIAIGNLAGLGVSATSDRNIFLGYGAGRYASSGCFNVAIGEHSGSFVTGNRNVFLGQYAGFNQCITGSCNVVIGDAICLPSASGSKQLAIGAGSTNWIEGDSDYNVTISGIATAYAATGIVSATKFCGDGSCLDGVALETVLQDAGINPTGISTFNHLNISGVSTFTGNIDANGDLDVDGHTELDNLNVSGITTLAGSVFLGYGGGSDQIHVGGRFASHLLPASTGTYNLGSPTESWHRLCLTGIAGIGSLSVAGVSTFTGDASFLGNVSIGGTLTYEDVTNIDSVGLITARTGIRVTGGVIEAQAGENKIPSLYANIAALPSASTYHGMFAHVHSTARGYFAHAGNWFELVNKEADGTVGTGTERYNIGPVDLTTLDVSGISTFNNNVFVGSAITMYSATGIISATKFCGDGSCLTNLPSGGFEADADLNLFASNTCSGCNLDGTSGCHNIFLGSCAGKCVTSGNGNVYLGQDAGRYSNSGGKNVSIGHNAGCCACTNAAYNVNIGNLAGAKLVSQCCSVNIGQCAGFSDFPGNSNVFIGSCAGWRGGCGGKNIAIGNAAGLNMKGTSKAVFLGDYAGRCIQGASNIAIGECALLGSSAPDSNTAGYNIAIGCKAGRNILTGEKNVILGTAAGHNMTSGSHNVLLGTSAGVNNSSGLRNIVIGCNVQLVATGNDQFAVGCGTCRWIEGDSSFNVTLAGIATVYSATGIVSATKFCGDGSCLTGLAGFSPDADENLVAGTCAGCNLDGTSGCFNLLLGACAGKNVTSGSNNIIVGCCAGSCLTTASVNIVIGKLAGWNKLSTQDGAILIGCGAGLNYAGGNGGSVIIGCNAGAGVSCNNGDRNTFIGHLAGQCNQAGLQNTFIGFGAGQVSGCSVGSDDAKSNVAVGYEAGKNVRGCCNISIGLKAGHDSLSNPSLGCANILMGAYTGTNLCTGNQNTFIGTYAGQCVTTGCENIGIGCGAMGSDTVTGRRNIVLGQCAGYFMTSGQNNILMGLGAGCCMCRADSNVVLGVHAGRNLNGATVASNVILGPNAACGIAGGTNIGNNIFLGQYAAPSVTNDVTHNIIMGRRAGKCLTTGNANVFLGMYAGCRATGSYNIYFGCGAGGGSTNVTGAHNIAIGFQVTVPDATGSCQLAIGDGSNRWIVGNSDFNVGIGTQYPNNPVTSANTKKLSVGILSAYQLYGDGSCLTNLPSGGFEADAQGNLFASNTCSGCNFSGTNAENNILLGCCAGRVLTCGDANIFMGKYAGDAATVGGCNVALGWKAGSDITTGCGNVYLGGCAGFDNNTGDSNVAIGCNAAVYRSGGTSNVFLGTFAGSNNTGQTGSCNIGIGYVTLGGQSSTACFNVAIGHRAGKSVTGGGCNIFLGLCSAENLTTGTDNIAIGRCAMQAGTVTGDDNIFLGREAGYCITTGGNNITQGCGAGKRITTASHNIFLGQQAGRGGADITGGCNIIIGANAGSNICTGYDNIFMGRWSGNSSQNSIGNVYIGTCAGTGNGHCDNYNTFIGYKAGRTQVGGCGNVIIGACIDQTPFICDAGGSANEGCQLVIGYSSNIWLSGNKDFNVGVGTTSAKTDFQVGSHYGVTGGIGTFTAAAGVAHTINEYTIASTDFKTAEYTIFANTGNKIQSQKLLVMQDGTTAYSQEYAVMSSDTLLVSAGANIASGVVKIEVTPETGVSGLTTFRFTRHTML